MSNEIDYHNWLKDDGTPVTAEEILSAASGIDTSYKANPAPGTPSTDAMLEFYKDASDKSNATYNQTITDIDAKNKAILEQIKNNRNSAISYAQNLNKREHSDATAAREKAIVDANNTYAANMSSYGAKAEALRSMGLTGGGYSEHVDALNYAANRDDIQAARAIESETKKASDRALEDATYKANAEANTLIYNANEKAREQKVTAKSTLDNTLLGIDEREATYKSGIFQNLMEKASEGKLSKKQVDELTKVYGFTEDEKNSLYASVETGGEYKDRVNTERWETNFATFKNNIYADPFGYSDEDVDRWISNDMVSEDLGAKLKEFIKEEQNNLTKYNNDVIDEKLGALDPESDTYTDDYFTVLDKAYDDGNGTMSLDDYQEKYLNFFADVIDRSKYKTTSDAVEALTSITTLKDAKKLSDEGYNQLVADIVDKLDAKSKEINEGSDVQILFGHNAPPRFVHTYNGKSDNMDNKLTPVSDANITKLLDSIGAKENNVVTIKGKAYIYDKVNKKYYQFDKHMVDRIT